MEKLNKIVLTTLANLMTFTSFGLSVPVFAEEKEVPVNITVEATPMNVTLPTSIELANAGNTVDVTVASTNKIANNANTGAVYIQDISLETLNNWSLGDKTAKYEEMSKDSKNLYLGIKLSDETDFANLKDTYEPTNQKLEAKSEKGLLFEGKTNITSSKLTNQVGNLVVTVGESKKVIQNGNLKDRFLNSISGIKRENITEMSFVNNQKSINKEQSWDVSVEGDGSVMAWIDQNNPTKVLVGAKNGKVIAPQDSGNLLASMEATSYIDVSNLDVSNVTNMSNMFYYTGGKAASFNIKGLETWNTSNTTNMAAMFGGLGAYSKTFNMGDISNWDVSKVIDISGMFANIGQNATNVSLDLSNWNTSNVIHMYSLFSRTAADANSFNIKGLDNWNVSNVTSMASVFHGAGQNAINWSIGDLSNWNISNVTDISDMFAYAAQNTETFNIGDLSKWDTSNVTTMDYMFQNTGKKVIKFDIGNLEHWNVSKVTNMSDVFTGNKNGFIVPSWIK